MKVSGVVIIDLRRITSASAARVTVWEALADIPFGADVRLLVPAWEWWAEAAVDQVLESAEHLGDVTIESDAQTVRRWVLCLRRGSRGLQAASNG